MILFFSKQAIVYAVDTTRAFNETELERLAWLFAGARTDGAESLPGYFVGPRREMVTPWSTNAVEITQHAGVEGILRIEEFHAVDGPSAPHDKMLQRIYNGLNQEIFTIEKAPDPIVEIDDLHAYNQQEGLALSEQEIEYLEQVSVAMGRKLTDSEVFGFSQVNSEHCRHKIFGGQFIIDGQEKQHTLFTMIKQTTAENRNRVVSAYSDNCAFLQGPVVEQFAPASHDAPDFYETKDFESVISLKAETHNFPTTVEPFNGAATGSGGEIRDRIAGGKGAFPMAGTAVYMTAYPRLAGGRPWEKQTEERPWLYQTPEEILIKASNGASTFGNHFGQPLLCGSVQTFEHFENGKKFGFDKVIMLAGGIGYGKKVDSLKDDVHKGDKIVLLGGDNYRIGMGGGAVSSVATGEYANAIELNAIQRANPEMQKRAYNVIRAVSEEDRNPIISIHDHGAGGHLNCLSELVEATGGRIDMETLPIGDPTLSAKEIVGNESQERMGLVLKEEDIDHLRRIADRERAPMYVIGEATGDMQFTFVNNDTGEKPIDWQLHYMFGSSPRTVLTDRTIREEYAPVQYNEAELKGYLENLLQLEGVACKDWLTNKVDRSVTGRVAMQQCAGTVQFPLNDCAVMALDFRGEKGMATALGHAAGAALVDAPKGSVLSIAESLTNLVFTPIAGGLPSVSLSANWMWPAKNPGEDARLYSAVEAARDFALALGINIPTGKDSMSMTQKYPGGDQVYAPGTVIVTSAGEVSDVKKSVSPALKHRASELVYVDFAADGFHLGGSSFGQIVSRIGGEVPTVTDAEYFKKAFAAVQSLIEAGRVLAGHDVSAGGLITTLLEMTFADNASGMTIDLTTLGEKDTIKVLFSEKPALVLQVEEGEAVVSALRQAGVQAAVLGTVNFDRKFSVANGAEPLTLDINALRDTWFKTSYLLDRRQSTEKGAEERYKNYKNQELFFRFPASFSGKLAQYGLDPNRKTLSGIRAAIIREKGSQCERETAYALYLAGFDVKDVHTTDLIAGRETLEDVNLIVFVGGFSNSDVLGSAKGWAGALKYSPKAKAALDNFYRREDTLSLGICNGCQLMQELELICPDDEKKPKMAFNNSHKFESNFVGLTIGKSNSVFLQNLEGSTLGVWIAHGEGKFKLPYSEDHYTIPIKYAYDQYPANPNGSDYNAAAISSADGRHLAMMPHPERAIKPWSCACYPEDRTADEVTPWIEIFVNAKNWISQKINE
ncbi:MAG: phosphoribosylformylglycinamidine synthase [Rikenellaceae bacterium]|jgi:phosphoribosylformylglycinamidine synthase|nr:phosphoribosylformylglycinamidine synthase [Rikenellaceae bacterium]